jgi:hypothetical protein
VSEFILLSYALIEARLSGRHGRDRAFTMEMLNEDGYRTADEMEELNVAFTEGEEAARSGYACHCRTCQSLTPAMREKEDRRVAYMLRRRDELEAQGVPRPEADARIEAEIGAGAALQEGAVVVRVLKGKP